MPILNYRLAFSTFFLQVGGVIGLNWPFTEEEVIEQLKIDRICARDRIRSQDLYPKDNNMTGSEFLKFISTYNEKRGFNG